jgi:hypothetical protein
MVELEQHYQLFKKKRRTTSQKKEQQYLQLLHFLFPGGSK